MRVTAGVIVRDGHVLVCQRRPGAEHGGQWEFPGGKVEPGESLSQCLRRELSEELGVGADVGDALWHTRHEYAQAKRVVLWFLFVKTVAGVLRNRVFAAIRWVPLHGLGELDFLEADREFVAALGRGEVVCPETRISSEALNPR